MSRRTTPVGRRENTAVPVKTHLAPMDFKPRHCAGAACISHDHAGSSAPLPPARVWLTGLFKRKVASAVTGRDPRLSSPAMTGSGRAS